MNLSVYLDFSFGLNDSGEATVSDGTVNVSYKIKNKRVDKGYLHSFHNVKGLPLRQVAEQFGFNVNYEPLSHSITIQ